LFCFLYGQEVEKQLAQYRRVIEQHLATAGNSKLFQHSEDIIRDGAHLFSDGTTILQRTVRACSERNSFSHTCALSFLCQQIDENIAKGVGKTASYLRIIIVYFAKSTRCDLFKDRSAKIIR
jgi:hypothetical protein